MAYSSLKLTWLYKMFEDKYTKVNYLSRDLFPLEVRIPGYNNTL